MLNNMLAYERKYRFDLNCILEDLIRILSEMSSGWERHFDETIEPETLLGADLAFTSLDLVRLIANIQRAYDRKDLPFQELFMPQGKPAGDICISDLAGFLHKHLNHR